MNTITLAGKVASAPELRFVCLDGENGRFIPCTQGFYCFEIEVKRASGIIDRIPVRMSLGNYNAKRPKVGDYISFKGAIKNYRTEEKKKVLFVKYLDEQEYIKDTNYALLDGNICSLSEPRVTPFGRQIVDGVIAVDGGLNKFYLDCIFWEQDIEKLGNYHKGMSIKFLARLQSRMYQKPDEDFSRTAYDICVTKILEKDR